MAEFYGSIFGNILICKYPKPFYASLHYPQVRGKVSALFQLGPRLGYVGHFKNKYLK
jgi:hypothetical protein